MPTFREMQSDAPQPYVRPDDDYPEFDEGGHRDAVRALRAFLKAHRTLDYAINTREPTATGRELGRKATVMAQVSYLWEHLPVIPRVAIRALYMHPSSASGDAHAGVDMRAEIDRIAAWRRNVYARIGARYGVSGKEVAELTNQAIDQMVRALRAEAIVS